MRKNLKAAWKAWEEWKPYASRSGSLRVEVAKGGCPNTPTRRRVIYSYRTPILVWQGGSLVLNVSKYSRTTTAQQNSLRALLTASGFWWSEVDDLPRECRVEAVQDGWRQSGAQYRYGRRYAA